MKSLIFQKGAEWFHIEIINDQIKLIQLYSILSVYISLWFKWISEILKNRADEKWRRNWQKIDKHCLSTIFLIHFSSVLLVSVACVHMGVCVRLYVYSMFSSIYLIFLIFMFFWNIYISLLIQNSLDKSGWDFHMLRYYLLYIPISLTS